LEAVIDQSRLKLRPSRLFLLSSVLIILIASPLRIHQVSQRSLWLDEAIAANISRGTVAETLTLTRALHSAPIVHPLILQTIEAVSTQPVAVRFPSLLASIFAVCLMLCFARIPSIDQRTAALAGLMLGVSASQIRYAQEVREYSLGVLFAALLSYLFLRTASEKGKPREPIILYLALFAAPLIQYGLVLFSLGVLAGLAVLALVQTNRVARIRQAAIGAGLLTAGSLLSYFLTVRYQWGEKVWYLEGNYYTPGSGLLQFIWTNSHKLATFLLPGRLAALISFVGIFLYLLSMLRTRSISPIVILAFTSFTGALACALLHLYPYGPIRQCLYLSPVLCLFASESLVQVADRFAPAHKQIVFFGIASVVVLSGAIQIRSDRPYSEIEDLRAILIPLRDQIEQQDQVYVYSGAVPAIDFYWKGHDPRFIYGDFHRDAPEKYLSEAMLGLRPETKRLWLVFSHIYQAEDQKILQEFGRDWNIQQIATAKASALYVGLHKTTSTDQVSSSSATSEIAKSIRPASPPHQNDSFLDWTLRNSTRPTN
jgi:Dolichyl-phosphate-mannose-protein mannosyltransferase